MYQVVRRNGETIDFDLSKISNAIEKAFVATGKAVNKDVVDLLALRVTADLKSKTAPLQSKIFKTAQKWC